MLITASVKSTILKYATEIFDYENIEEWDADKLAVSDVNCFIKERKTWQRKIQTKQ